MGLAYRHVDVFADAPLTGNALTIVFDADALDGAAMARLTREFRQFETIFLSAIDLEGRHAAARIFTVEEELDFAGHPVIGAAAALHERAGLGADPAAWAITVAGRALAVTTQRDGAGWRAEMSQGQAAFGPPLDAAAAIPCLAALGLAAGDLASDAPPRVVSTGLPYLILPVSAAALVRAAIIVGDFEVRLAALGAKFVYVLDPAAREGRTWDNFGVVEDVATGSAAGPAAAWLVAARLADAEKPFIITQGRCTGRPSAITVRIDDAGEVFVSGHVAGVVRGELDPGVG